MNDFTQVCPVDMVPSDAPLTVEIDGRPVAIFRVGEEYYAVEDICPHQGASFEGGALDDEIVTFPLHGWRLNVITGGSLEAPGIKIETYDVEVVDGSIYVRL